MNQKAIDIGVSIGDFASALSLLVGVYEGWTTFLVVLGVARIVGSLASIASISRCRYAQQATAMAVPATRVAVPAASVMVAVLRVDEEKLLLACGHELDISEAPAPIRGFLKNAPRVACVDCARELASTQEDRHAS